MSIVFEVIDITCQQSNLSFFVPNVVMTTQSTSTFATVLGYSEFGTPSIPPKKYRTITFNGSSQRIGFTAEQTPRQCAGAQYVYSGVGQIDVTGKQISKYSKKFYAQCSKQFWPTETLALNDLQVTTGGPSPQFVGFCWPQIPQSCPVCDPQSINWPFLGDQAVNVPNVDLAAFMAGPNDAVITKTSFTINAVFNAFTSIVSDTAYTFSLFGTIVNNYTISVPPLSLTARAVITNPNLDFPAVAIQDSHRNFITAGYIVFTDTNNYSAVLSDEYTDAIAAANATVVQGTGNVAQNLPRTTGFTSVTTAVIFTISCTNLISGQNYVISVDFWDSATNTTSTNQYPFTASGTTNTIVDSIPTPAAGHTTQVKNARIAFAT